jgi:hypothetical protein
MKQTTDMETALSFVIGRIEEEAMLSGEPLTEDERNLLHDLPRTPSMPDINSYDRVFPVDVRLRDTTYERLCALAKAARLKDVALNPTMLDWDFVFSVAKLNNHPMCWLLQWAGVKQRRPWWDRWLLVGAACLFLGVTMPLLFLIVDKPPAIWRWIVAGGGYGIAILCMYFASRRIEKKQLERNIERFRNASGLARAVAR